MYEILFICIVFNIFEVEFNIEEFSCFEVVDFKVGLLFNVEFMLLCNVFVVVM